MQIEMRRNGFRGSAGQRNERFLCRLFRSGLLRRRCCFRVDPNCCGRDSCGTGAMIERLLLLLRLRLCTDPAFLRYRTPGGGFCCRVSLQSARFLRYRSWCSHAAHSRRFPALPFGRSCGNRSRMCDSLRRRLFCATALCGNWALRSALFRRTRCIRPRGPTWGRTSFAVGRRRCRRYRRCGCGMLPICGAAIHTDSAGRLHRAAGLLGRNMILLRDLGVSIRGNARRLLHGLGITPADGRALRSCCTGRWRILRTTRLLRPRTSSRGIALRSRTNALCRMGSWLFSCCTVLCGSWRCAAVRHRRISCHTGSRRNWCRRMFCCVRSLHKGTTLLNGFCLRISYLAAVRMVWHSCAADSLCRAARCGRRRCRIVRHCWRDCIRRAPLCARRLYKGAALLRRLALHRPSLRIAAVIRFSCAAGWLTGTARRILACRFSYRTERNRASMILYRCAAARMEF